MTEVREGQEKASLALSMASRARETRTIVRKVNEYLCHGEAWLGVKCLVCSGNDREVVLVSTHGYVTTASTLHHHTAILLKNGPAVSAEILGLRL